jgi:hypothetical protein
VNLKTLTISIIPCFVRDYPFSDKHHIWPQAKGGKSLPTIMLCPNHHRFANLVQTMLFQGVELPQIEAFTQKHLDPQFNTKALRFLITEQEHLAEAGWEAYAKQREHEARLNPYGAEAAAAARCGLHVSRPSTWPPTRACQSPISTRRSHT